MLKLRHFLPFLVFAFSFYPLKAQLGFDGHTIVRNQSYTGQVHSSPSSPIVTDYPSHGTFTGFSPQGNGDFKYTYTPEEGYLGLDEMTIEVRNGFFNFDYITVKFSVVKSLMQLKEDYSYMKANGGYIFLNVLNNDISNYPLTLKEIIYQEGGKANIETDGQISFSPNVDYTGMAHIRYVACDSIGTCGSGLLTIAVGHADYTDIVLGTTKNTTVKTPLDRIGYQIDVAPSNGTVQINNGLELVYTPNEDYFGEDFFTMKKDENIRSISVTVYNTKKSNTLAIPDVVYTAQNTVVRFNVTDNDYGNYYVKGFSQPNIGSLEYNGSGNFTFTPPPNFISGTTFTYQIGNSFNPNVETTKVEILIGNQAPYKSTFELTTSKNAPMVIKYPSTFKDFGYEEVTAPKEGSLEFFEGEQTIFINGKEVSGNNLLVYYPNDGYIGIDKFDINFCLTENEECSPVKVIVDVIDAPATCFDDCVWPGDANADGEVNAQDLLMMGLYFGATGPTRTDNTTAWYAHEAENWDTPSEVNLKHCDTNGDGIISAADTTGLSNAFTKNNNLVPFIPATQKQIPINFGEPSVANAQPGDFVSIPLILGSENKPAVDIYGFTFNLNYWVDAFEDAYISFEEESWLTQNDAALSIAKAPVNGQLSSAFTRTGKLAASGYGIIGTLNFVIDDDLDGIKGNGELELSISGGSVSNAYGQSFGIQNGNTIYKLNLAGTGLAKIDESKVIVYPNPAAEEINIHLNGGFLAQKIEIMDAQGREIFYVRGLETNHFTYPLVDMMPGIYMAKVFTADGIVFKRFTVVKK